MKKIKSITEYPFINYMINWRIDNGYIDIEAEEEAEKELKAAINKLTDYREALFELSDLITNLTVESENTGFLNGYLTAVEVLQGKLN